MLSVWKSLALGFTYRSAQISSILLRHYVLSISNFDRITAIYSLLVVTQAHFRRGILYESLGEFLTTFYKSGLVGEKSL